MPFSSWRWIVLFVLTFSAMTLLLWVIRGKALDWGALAAGLGGALITWAILRRRELRARDRV